MVNFKSVLKGLIVQETCRRAAPFAAPLDPFSRLSHPRPKRVRLGALGWRRGGRCTLGAFRSFKARIPMPTRGIGASTRSRGGRMRSGAEGKFFAVASLAVLAVCMGGSEGSLGSVARVVRLQEAACLRSWGGGGGAMRLRGGGKKQEAEDAKAALLEREIAEGDAVMAEDVTSNCVMREVQDPNEYEPGQSSFAQGQGLPTPHPSRGQHGQYLAIHSMLPAARFPLR